MEVRRLSRFVSSCECVLADSVGVAVGLVGPVVAAPFGGGWTSDADEPDAAVTGVSATVRARYKDPANLLVMRFVSRWLRPYPVTGCWIRSYSGTA